MTAPEDMLEKEKWIGLNTLVEIEEKRIIKDRREIHMRILAAMVIMTRSGLMAPLKAIG